jgi:hypothetical protein
MHRHRVAQLHIDFSWHRDQTGYRLLAAEPSKPEPRNVLAALQRGEITFPPSLFDGFDRGGHDLGKPQRIVRCGGDLIAYRPLTEFDGLFRQFTNLATTPAGVLEFIEKFGPLTLGGLDEKMGEDVQTIIKHARNMHQILDIYSCGDKSALVRMMGPSGIGMGARIETALIVDPVTKTPKLQLTVRDLLTALWIQFGQAISSGATIRQCQLCSDLFEVGPGTGRRLDAKFCSDEHRVVFNSVKRNQGR